MTAERSLQNWIIDELNKRDWSQGELARRANITRGHISHILSGSRNAGAEVCIAIAKAFNEPPEKGLEMGGYLSKREPEPRLRDVMHKFRLLDDQEKADLEKYLDYLLATADREKAHRRT
jgi:transcriptional regulator with XRE-family HTH domain